MATDDKTKRPRQDEAGDDAPRPRKAKKRPAAAEGDAAARKAKARKAEPKPEAEPAPAREEPEADDDREAARSAEGDESEALVVRGGADISISAASAAATAARKGLPTGEGDELAEGEGGDDDEPAAAQLGVDRYVMAAFFAAGMIGAYIFGKVVHGLWSWAANKDFFNQNLPTLAAVGDDDKTTIGTVLGGIVALVVVLRTYKKPDIRAWADEVATEMTKVKWPTRKDVTSSTFVVLAASAIASTYLFLLDRLWAFVTNLVYGSGS